MTKEIKLTATDTRITLDEQGIPTVCGGCGGLIIWDTYAKDGSHAGIAISLGEGEIGEKATASKGKTRKEVDAFLKLVSTKPESLQVMIERLQAAKANFGSDGKTLIDVPETVTISKERLDSLEDDELKLQCLENGGVDNWTQYDEAMEDYWVKQEEEDE